MEKWNANRIIYRADEEMDEFYRSKLMKSRRRGRRRKKKAGDKPKA